MTVFPLFGFGIEVVYRKQIEGRGGEFNLSMQHSLLSGS